MESMASGPKIRVAITGALQRPRAAVAALIAATDNGEFVEYINLHTHYLVCTKHDSNKAQKAARLGTAVISEVELNEYLEAGRFPSTELPKRPRGFGTVFPDIAWTHKAEPELCLMTYCDSRGNWTIRRMLWTSNGRSPGKGGDEWIGGYDGPQFKCWRSDRVADLEVLMPHPAGDEA